MIKTSEQQKRKALAAFVEYGTISAACKAAGIGRSTWYGIKKDDPQFAADAEHAKHEVADGLEQEAIRRAYDGSDVLLIFLLKGHKPEKFKERNYSEVRSETKNAHTHEPVSSTNEWIEDLLGTGQAKPAKEPVQN